MQTATKRLSVSAVLLGIIGGIIGFVGGVFLGFALGAALASVFHVSSFEGGAGYFAIAIAIIVTVLIAPVAILVTLYWRGIRGFGCSLGWSSFVYRCLPLPQPGSEFGMRLGRML